MGIKKWGNKLVFDLSICNDQLFLYLFISFANCLTFHSNWDIKYSRSSDYYFSLLYILLSGKYS